MTILKDGKRILDQLELALETPEVQQLIDSPKLAYKGKDRSVPLLI